MKLKDRISGAWRRIRSAIANWRGQRPQGPSEYRDHIFRARAYPGSRKRRYRVQIPAACQGDKPRPLVMVLHGCNQDHHDIEQISGFNAVADQHDFLVVYPFVTSYRGMRNKNCWGWWFDREIHAGAGEVEDLWQIIDEVSQHYPVDPNRIHVAGLSSGAGMIVAMLVAHADRIASGAAVAGVPYAEKARAVRHGLNQKPRNRPVVAIVREMREEMGECERAVPIQIVHSANDETVDINSAHILRDSWGHCFGVDTRSPGLVEVGETAGTTWEHACYPEDGRRSVIETVFLEGPGHGWYGGPPGKYSFPDAPDATREIWRFFAAHPLEARLGDTAHWSRAG
jgi:poly(hydroxyalkanoate) depolymerase family esterase